MSDDPRTIKTYGKEVAPALREAVARERRTAGGVVTPRSDRAWEEDKRVPAERARFDRRLVRQLVVLRTQDA